MTLGIPNFLNFASPWACPSGNGPWWVWSSGPLWSRAASSRYAPSPWICFNILMFNWNAQSQHGCFSLFFSVSYIWPSLTWRWHSPRPLAACSSPSWALRAGVRVHWCSSAPAGRQSENRTLTLCSKIVPYYLIFLDIHIRCNWGSLVGKLCEILHSNLKKVS